MNKLAGFLAGVLRDLTRSRAQLVKENAFLRAQLQACKAQTPRPKLDAYDRALLLFLSRVVPRWRQLLVVVTPETLIPALENANAERFVGSVRREALRHFGVVGERHLRWILSEFIPYYNRRRVHQGIDQQVPAEVECPVERPRRGRVVREEFLNGILVEYRRAA